jgi:opacity protein-like surface antigen
MRLFKFVPVAALFIVGTMFVGAPAARAQYHFGYSQPRDIDITGFAGGRFFGSVDLPTDPVYDYLKIDNNYDYGLMGDVGLFGPFQAEFMWSRQPTSLEAHIYGTGDFASDGNVTLDDFQWSLLYQMGDSSAKFHPYFGGGIGFTHWENAANVGLPFNNTVGFNLGGGVKYYFVKHFGMRIDFRWLPTRTTSQLAQYCDPFYGCYAANQNNYAEQLQLNGGLVFRF